MSLSYYIEKNDLEFIKKMTLTKEKILAGYTLNALLLSCRYKYTDIFIYLTETYEITKNDMFIISYGQYHIFFYACFYNCKDILNYLIKKFNITKEDNESLSVIINYDFHNESKEIVINIYYEDECKYLANNDYEKLLERFKIEYTHVLFTSNNTCCICNDNSTCILECNHNYCMNCYINYYYIYNNPKLCAMCRKFILSKQHLIVDSSYIKSNNPLNPLLNPLNSL